MTNLGGHDLPAVLEAFHSVDHDRPVCFIAYTVKGYGLPLAGHKDNHAGLMTPEQMASYRASLGVREGHEWDPFEAVALPRRDIEAFLEAVPFNARGRRRFEAERVAVPQRLATPEGEVMSTQEGFGKILNEIAREPSPLAERIVTTSPDVTVSTNLGPWVNRRGLFSRTPTADTFRDERVPSAQKWTMSPRWPT